MKTQNTTFARPVDVHAALARAHADRAEYIQSVLAKLPAFMRRLATKVRPDRRHAPRNGVWA